VKPIDGFAARWDFILARVLAADNDASIRLAVVGGGAGGVELCFAIQYRLHKEMIDRGKDPSKLRISIYNRGKTLMSSHNRSDKMTSRIAFSN
jgi:selenide, water dikinase